MIATEFDAIIPPYGTFQKLRLILSTYQDGSGQLRVSENKTLPGWRDFERAVAIAFHGKAQESKSIFDVIVPDGEAHRWHYGISCKMRGTLRETIKRGYVSLELSNSAKQFWDAISGYQINEQTYRNHAALVGKALIERVQRWYDAAGTKSGGNVILTKSFYLTLSWDQRSEQYQLHQFRHNLPDPTALVWDFPNKKLRGELVEGSRLVGKQDEHKLLEWYGQSGGQLKYYPLTKDAIWHSDIFRLEPLPKQSDSQTVIMTKIQSYFPEQWAKIDSQL